MTVAQGSTAAIDDRYLALVRAFPLVPLRDEAHLDRAIAVIDDLLDRPDLSAPEQDYLDVLSNLVETFERDHYALPAVSGVEVLRHLMAEHRLRQVDLAPLLGSKSIVSEVLSGKRRLALNHVVKLSRYFGVSPEAFLRDEA